MKEIDFCAIGGFSLGHAANETAATGCSVLLFDALAPAGVAIRGGGPASRETPLLDPLAAAEGLHALLLSGGSAFGLDAAGGVMQYLEGQGIGFDVGVTKVPLVCQSCIFDLTVGDCFTRPDAAMAIAACNAANRSETRMGNVGAGMGASVGKYRGMACAMKGGLGMAAVQVGDVKLGAIVVVNALGDVFDIDTGAQIAGLRTADGGALCSTEAAFYADMAKPQNLFTGNTTIGAVLTNAQFSKAELCKIASMAHNGYARAIRPVHTTADGDSIYALSVGDAPCTADINIIGTLAAEVMARAIARGVRAAKAFDDLPCAQDFA